MISTRRRSLGFATALVLSMGLVVGCSPSDPGGEADTTPPEETGQTEDAPEEDGAGGEAADLETLNVGLMPVTDLAPVYLGIEKGFYAEEGLELNIMIAQGGAAIVPAVLSGEYDVGFSNVLSLLIADERGLPIKIIANASSSSQVRGADSVDVAVLEDSDIQRPRDLEGRTVATNALNNFGEIATRNSVEVDGGDPSKVNFVEIPYPNMPAQLAAGEIDAAWTSEPFRTQILEEGGRIIATPLLDLGDDADLAHYFTSEDTLASKGDLIDRFIDATYRSMDYAQANEDEVREIIQDFAGLDEDWANTVVLTRWPTVINLEALTALTDASIRYGVMEEARDFDELIYTK